MAGIEERASDREQTERREMVVRHPTPDGRVRHVDEQDSHVG